MAVEIPFTPRAKRVLEMSLEEARQLGMALPVVMMHVEHLFLGPCGLGPYLPVFPTAKRGSPCVCMHAWQASCHDCCLSLAPSLIPAPSPLAGHNYIGTEHILLGLLREGEGVAARVLETLGADPAKIRTQVSECRGSQS